MRLKDILKDCEITKGNVLDDFEVEEVSYDSRKATKNSLFVAIRGEKYDGHEFIKDAIRNGALAVICEDGYLDIIKGDLPDEILLIGVSNTRKALACVANNFFGRPSERLTLIGVTGTNGKTTTTYLVKSILDRWGRKAGLIGTIQYMIGDKIYPAIHTTPESLEYQGILRDMVSSGCSFAVSEVSSHALAQYRVDRAKFDIAVFTNLTRDHLDFHLTMENYYIAKRRLFDELLIHKGAAIINIDDEYGLRLYRELKDGVVGSNKEIRILLTSYLGRDADITAHNVKATFDGLDFDIMYNNNICPISSKLTGFINVYNILSAFGVAVSLDIPFGVISEGIKDMDLVKGRFEKIDLGQPFLCIIDYAHSPDALERLIIGAKELAVENVAHRCRKNTSHIITVFGCGGDRDRGKRPEMGRIATMLSDFTIITSDNPRTEDPLSIIKDIESGVVSKNYVVIPEREEAIKVAIEMAGSDDVVLIAGKGHEDYQEIKGERYKFSDKEVAEKYIKKRIMNDKYIIK
jgi:UDP-N-acetylmuramoyl-L-alanyl-D-glutamate--2,6-diaminopimelate ligase